MASALLLRPKPGFHVQKFGLPRPRGCRPCSSSSEAEKSSQGKKLEAVAGESDMQKSMGMDPGIIPTQTQVWSARGSFYTIGNIVNQLKARMLGPSQSQNGNTTLMSDPRLDIAVLDDSPHTCADNTEFGQAKHIEQPLEALTNAEKISKNETPHVMEGNSLDSMVNTTSSKVIKNNDKNSSLAAAAPLEIEKNSSEDKVCKTVCEGSKMFDVPDRTEVSEDMVTNHNPTEVGEPVSTVLLSDVFMSSHSKKKNESTTAISHMKGENLSVDIAQSEDTPDMSKLVEPKSRKYQLNKVVKGIVEIFEGDLVSKSQKLSHTECQSPNGNTDRALPNDDVGQLHAIGIGNRNCQHNKKTTYPGLSSDDEYIGRTVNNRAPGEMVSQKGFASKLSKRLSEDSTETSGKNVTKSSDINLVIDFVKKLSTEQKNSKSNDSICNQTDRQSNRGMPMEEKEVGNNDPVGRIQSCLDLKKSNSKGGLSSDTAVPCPAAKKPDTSSIREESEHNKVLVRFLPQDTSKSKIITALQDCGRIVKVSELPHVKGSILRDADVYFETSAGQQKALEKTDLMVKEADFFVERISSSERNSNSISIPDLIGDPDVPGELVKNLTQTAMIKGLTPDLSWKHLEEALSCGEGISALMMGSSSSVAYVEFKTEEAKEKAIARHSFQVLGQRVEVFRIDAPRTTVARISNFSPQTRYQMIYQVCSRYGKVKKTFHREKDIVDVHFIFSEWPNMLHILNSLNGVVVDNCQWVAQPATVYPPEVLRALWSRPDGRKHVKAIIRNLLQKIGSPSDIGWLSNLTDQYYGDP